MTSDPCLKDKTIKDARFYTDFSERGRIRNIRLMTNENGRDDDDDDVGCNIGDNRLIMILMMTIKATIPLIVSNVL